MELVEDEIGHAPDLVVQAPCDMACHMDIWQSVKVTPRVRRLRGLHIQKRCEIRSRLENLHHTGLIDLLAPSGVDEGGVLPHAGKMMLLEHPSSARPIGEVITHHISPAKGIFQGHQLIETQLPRLRTGKTVAHTYDI